MGELIEIVAIGNELQQQMMTVQFQLIYFIRIYV